MNSTPIQQQFQSPVIFSFGQQNNSQTLPRNENQSFEHECRSKLQFVKRLIQKYEQKPSTSPLKLRNSSSRKKQDALADLSKHSYKQPLSTSRHHHDDSRISDHHSTKDESSILNRSKSDLEQSHQQILEKYTTPIQNDRKHLLTNSENQSSIRYENTIFELLNLSNEHLEQIQESNQKSNSTGSIPLIESVLMFQGDKQSSLKKQAPTKESPINEISEFQIEDRTEEKDDLKISHLLILCGLILIFLCWTI